MKKIKTVEAIGLSLCHDITKITNDFKGVAFKKGHVIREEDIQQLLNLGKDHIYIWEEQDGFLHENDATERLKNIVCGDGIECSEIKEGKIEFFAKYNGLFKVDLQALTELNMIDDLILSVIYNNTIVNAGDKIGATKVIPLLVDEKKLEKAENLFKKPIINVNKFNPKKTAIITTGSEVYYGRIEDKFGDVLKNKLKNYDCEIIGRVILPDDGLLIEKKIVEYIYEGAELILCTGGMSVDPDDLTPLAIKNTGSEIISYGTPVLPGAMFLMAYYSNIPIMGLPGSVIFSDKTAFDLLLARVLSGEKITKQTIAELSHGGFLNGIK